MDDDTRFARPTVVHDEPDPDDGGRRGTRIETPYDGDFVAAVKDRWRHGARLWSPEEEVWWVAAGHEEEVEELVMEHFGGVMVVDADGSERIRSRRAHLDLTQAEVARRAGINRSYLSELERGQARATIGTAGELAEALETTVGALLAE